MQRPTAARNRVHGQLEQVPARKRLQGQHRVITQAINVLEALEGEPDES